MKTRRLPFIKMNGAGNDFVFLSRDEVKVSVTPQLARRLLDRHFGIGGDQLLVLDPGNTVKRPNLRIYNADGSPAEMCGNGVRAVAFYLRQFKGVRRDFVLQTGAGPIGVGFRGKKIEVDMGRPVLGKRRTIKAEGRSLRYQAVSMGNPHCVIFVPNVKKFPVESAGPAIERHSFFPNRTNVEFVQVLSKGRVRARVWERGAGETLACGTGACAILAASAAHRKTSRSIDIELPGGTLSARWADDDRIFLSGPADVNFSGTFLY